MKLYTLMVSAFLATTQVFATPLQPRANAFFTPTTIWKYNTGTGAIAATTSGLVAKSNNGQDTTALLTFTYPSAASGKQCQFAFYLDNAATLNGSRKLDLYTSTNPAPGPRSTWPPGNQRNIHLGRISAIKGGFATWDAKYSTYLTQKTPCKAPGTVEGFELTGVYDQDTVGWNPAVAGPRIIYS